MTVALPIRLDDDSTRVFTGYRVQHHLMLGPTNGGLRILENAWTQVLNMGRRQRIPVCLAALSLGSIKRLQQSKRVRGLFP